MFKKTILFILLVYICNGDDTMLSNSQMKNFYLSNDIKDQIVQDMKIEIGISVANAKKEIEKQIAKELESVKNLNSRKIDDQQIEIKKLQEQVAFLKEMLVDTNYQRNLREDGYRRLTKEIEDLKETIKTLSNKKEPPITIKEGDKM